MIGRIAMATTMLGMTAAAQAEGGFAPGAWFHQTTMVSADVPGFPQWMIKLFAGNRTRNSCYTPAEASIRPEALLTQDDAAVCKTRHFAMADGKFAYDTFCINKRFPDGLLIVSKGAYTAGNYTMSTLSTGLRNGKPVKIVTTGSGKRTGPCR